jgi:hypothetical protein
MEYWEIRIIAFDAMRNFGRHNLATNSQHFAEKIAKPIIARENRRADCSALQSLGVGCYLRRVEIKNENQTLSSTAL